MCSAKGDHVGLSYNDILFGEQVEGSDKLQREVVANAPPNVTRGDEGYYASIYVFEDELVTLS